MKRLILATLLLIAPAWPQQQPAPDVTRLVQLKYLTDMGGLRSIIEAFGVGVRFDVTTRAITISGQPARVEAALDAVAKLDHAPKNIELTAYFVIGSDQPNLSGAPVPAEIRDVIGQLKSVFTFKDYRMLDILTLRTRSGSSAETTGILTSGASPRLSLFSIRDATVSEDNSVVRINRMHAGLRIPVLRANTAAAKNPGEAANRIEYMNTGIDQDVDIKEGQKVVVGRASLEGPEKALFIILTAHIIP
jgi:hypothetical protein